MNQLSMDDFIPFIERLRKVYGDKAYPTERAEIVYKAFRYSRPEIVSATIEEIIGEHMHAPPITKIREALYATRKKFGDQADPWEPIRKQIQENERKSNCPYCFGSGVFMAHRRDDSHEYAYCFACNCHGGSLAIQLPENKGKIQHWNLASGTEWSHGFESEIERTSKAAGRKVITGVFAKTDLNNVLDLKLQPKRGIEEEMYDPER